LVEETGFEPATPTSSENYKNTKSPRVCQVKVIASIMLSPNPYQLPGAGFRRSQKTAQNPHERPVSGWIRWLSLLAERCTIFGGSGSSCLRFIAPYWREHPITNRGWPYPRPHGYSPSSAPSSFSSSSSPCGTPQRAVRMLEPSRLLCRERLKPPRWSGECSLTIRFTSAQASGWL